MELKNLLNRFSFFLLLFMGVFSEAIAQKDTIPPVITGTCGDTLKVDIASVWLFQMPPVHDNQTDSADIVVLKTWSGKGPVNTLIRGYYILELDAVDSSGNKTHCTICYKVDDFEAPVIHLNTDDTICHKIRTPYSMVMPTATDNYYNASQISITLLSSNVNENVSGVYEEKYKAVDGSGNISYKTRVVIVSENCNTAGINDVFQENISVYPNPADQYFYITLNGHRGHLKIVSMDGKVVFESTVEGNAVIRMGELSAGVYMLQLERGGDMQSHKLVIRH